jgi:hypothetical protein
MGIRMVLLALAVASAGCATASARPPSLDRASGDLETAEPMDEYLQRRAFESTLQTRTPRDRP